MEELEIREQFEITDDSTAEWAIKKIIEAKKERQRLLELVDAEKANLEIKKRPDQQTIRNRHGLSAFKA